jgi:hypothetical protein
MSHHRRITHSDGVVVGCCDIFLVKYLVEKDRRNSLGEAVMTKFISLV